MVSFSYTFAVGICTAPECCVTLSKDSCKAIYCIKEIALHLEKCAKSQILKSYVASYIYANLQFLYFSLESADVSMILLNFFILLLKLSIFLLQLFFSLSESTLPLPQLSGQPLDCSHMLLQLSIFLLKVSLP